MDSNGHISLEDDELDDRLYADIDGKPGRVRLDSGVVSVRFWHLTYFFFLRNIRNRLSKQVFFFFFLCISFSILLIHH